MLEASVNGQKPSTHEPASLLALTQTESSQNQQRYQEIPFEKYLIDIQNGKISEPYQNSARLNYLALTQKPPLLLKSGFKEYPTLSQRTDNLSIKGLYPSIENIVNLFDAYSKTSGKDRVIALIAPTGAAKTTLTLAIARALEQFSKTGESQVLAIKDCPYNEHPLHLLGQEGRKQFHDLYKINITTQLCHICQHNLATKFNHDKLKIPLQPINFSLEAGRGIGTIEPKYTRYLDAQALETINKIYRKSNRGLLIFSEFCQNEVEFFATLHDLFRGRFIKEEETSFQLDNQILCLTTTDEFKEFQKDPQVKSLQERIDPIYIPYNTSRTFEVQIYQKEVFSHPIANSIHLAPKTLEVAANIALLSRYIGDSPTPVEKLSLYDGLDTEKYNQSQRPEIEKKAKDVDEGLIGLSPVFMSQKLLETMTTLDNCLHPLKVLIQIHEKINTAPKTLLPGKDRYLQFVNQARNIYETELPNLILAAFTDRYEQSCQIILQSYLENCDYFLNKTKKYNPETNKDEAAADLNFLNKVEDEMVPSPPQQKRAELRHEIFTKAFSRSQAESFNYSSHPLLKTGILKMVTGTSFSPEELLKKANYEKGAVTGLDEKELKLWMEAKERLISTYNYCETCSVELIIHASNLLKKKS